MTEQGMFDVEIWGTVGQWVGIAATLLIAFLSIWYSQAGERRERQREAEKHVQMLVVTVDPVFGQENHDGIVYFTQNVIGTQLKLINAGVSLLTHVSVQYSNPDEPEVSRTRHVWPVGLLRAGREEISLDLPIWMQWNDFQMMCTDINGVTWTKSRYGSIESLAGEPRRRWKFWRRG